MRLNREMAARIERLEKRQRQPSPLPLVIFSIRGRDDCEVVGVNATLKGGQVLLPRADGEALESLYARAAELGGRIAVEIGA